MMAPSKPVITETAIAEKLAERERAIEVKEEVWQQLDRLSDDAYRELLDARRSLDDYKAAVAKARDDGLVAP